MEGLLLAAAGCFVLGFGAGAVLNHPRELSARRHLAGVAGAWLLWTIACVAMAVRAAGAVCPPGGCIGVALAFAWIGLAATWMVVGVCVTAGLYVSRSYLRRHPGGDPVEAAFQAHVAQHPSLRDAVLVRQVDDTGDHVGLQTHRIYRDAQGGYFLFICTRGEPGYLTLLTRERAENALRSDPSIFRREFGRDP